MWHVPLPPCGVLCSSKHESRQNLSTRYRGQCCGHSTHQREQTIFVFFWNEVCPPPKKRQKNLSVFLDQILDPGGFEKSSITDQISFLTSTSMSLRQNCLSIAKSTEWTEAWKTLFLLMNTLYSVVWIVSSRPLMGLEYRTKSINGRFSGNYNTSLCMRTMEVVICGDPRPIHTGERTSSDDSHEW